MSYSKNNRTNFFIILLSFILTTLAPSNFFGQISFEDSTVYVLAHWSKGDKFTYSIESTSYTIINDDTSDTKIMNGLIDIAIVDSTDSNYIMKWDTYGSVFDGYDDWFIELFSQIDTITYIVETNSYGQFYDLHNWEEIRDVLAGVVENMLMDTSKEAQMVSRLLDFKNLYSSRGAVMNLVVEEINYMQFFHGNIFKFDEVYHSQIEAPNYMSNIPVLINRLAYIDTIYVDDNSVALYCDMEADTTSIANSVKTYLNEKLQSIDAPDSLKNSFKEMEITRTEFLGNIIHVGFGWTTYSYYDRVITSGDTKIMHTVTIDML